jgi:hypothetical protein
MSTIEQPKSQKPKLTPEERRARQSAGARKANAKRRTTLTRKEQAFADGVAALGPDETPTDVAARVYDVSSRQAASEIASENLSKPKVLAYLDQNRDQAQLTVVEIMETSRSRASDPKHAKVALDAANSLLDRTDGKPTQRVQTESKVLEVFIDLSGKQAKKQG